MIVGALLMPIIALIVAVIGAIIAFNKYRSDRDFQRFTNALHMYRRYLELAFQYPQFAEPPLDRKFEGAEYSKYEWFVGILLRACEELLEFLPSDPERWKQLVRSLLKAHAAYFKEDEWFNKEGLQLFSSTLRDLVDEVVKPMEKSACS